MVLPTEGSSVSETVGGSSGGDSIVTPEAVVLQFEPAGIGSRGAAAFIDWVIRFVAIALGLLMAEIFEGFDVGPSWLGVTAMTVFGFVVLVLYPIIFEAAWHGKTPGKAAMGIRVVTTNGAPIGLRHAAVRGTIGFFELTASQGLIAIIAAFVNKQSRRLGDLAAGTIVLRQRSAAKTPTSVRFEAPVEGAEFAATLDVAHVRTEDYNTIRSFLLRAKSLDGKARHAVADQLAHSIADRIGVEPQPNLTAEQFLACVAWAYQRRFDR